MDVAGTQDQAKNAWTSRYPFESMTGGQGVPLMTASTSSGSTRVALVGDGNALCLTNDGDVTVYVAWGNANVTATTAYFPVPMGTQLIVSLPKDAGTLYIACLTREGTSYLSAHRGYGN